MSNLLEVYADVVCSLTERGVLDAIEHGISVESDRTARFSLKPSHPSWHEVFSLQPEPLREDGSGEIRSVQLRIGRMRSVEILHSEPEEVCNDPYLVLWPRPEIEVLVGAPVAQDHCPSLDGLLKLEREQIELARKAAEDLQLEAEKLIQYQWRAWVVSEGRENVTHLVEYLTELATESNDLQLGKPALALQKLVEEVEAAIAEFGAAVDEDQLATFMSIACDAFAESQLYSEALANGRAKLTEVAEGAEWARIWGSKRLQLAVRAGLFDQSLGAYRDERLAADRPGWRWLTDKDRPLKDSLNPSEDEITALLEARRFDSGAELKFIPNVGTVVLSEFLHRSIVRLVSRPRNEANNG